MFAVIGDELAKELAKRGQTRWSMGAADRPKQRAGEGAKFVAGAVKHGGNSD